MKLRPFCVTVMDNWTPTREFFTLSRALAHAAQHAESAHVWIWSTGFWRELDIKMSQGGRAEIIK